MRKLTTVIGLVIAIPLFRAASIGTVGVVVKRTAEKTAQAYIDFVDSIPGTADDWTFWTIVILGIGTMVSIDLWI